MCDRAVLTFGLACCLRRVEVAALEAWLRAAGVTREPGRRLTRSGACAAPEPMGDQAVARVAQVRVAGTGPDPALFGRQG